MPEKTIKYTLLVVTALVAINSHAAIPSHCATEEITLFSCQIEKSAKVVSVCASQPLSATSSLAYRFGKPGNIELEYPGTSEHSLSKFRFAHYFRYQTERITLSFNVGNYQYTVFDYYEGEEEPSYGRGVVVDDTRHDKEVVSLMCRDEVITTIRDLNELVPCDKESALANCR